MEAELTEMGNVAPPPPAPSQNHIEAWVATLVSGQVIRSDECESYDFLPGPVESVVIRVEGVEHHVMCAPQFGERIRWFTRRAHKGVGPGGLTTGEPINMPVVEIMKEGGGPHPRLYIHPRHGVILSTLDLQL